MGIPAFYRWLVDRYPLSVVEVIEEAPKVVNGVRVPADSTGPNPNGVEFDNLYLDMNGIIHPCFHPKTSPDADPTKPAGSSLSDPAGADPSSDPGQRSGSKADPRLDPAKPKLAGADSAKPAESVFAESRRRGSGLAPNSYDEVYEAVFEYIDRIFLLIRPRKLLFMAIDGVAPRAKMNQQRARRFRAAKDAADTVILSDANVPGEGEHKIASYIRAQRNLSGFDPNTRHCLYGLDADLIMLALATHEIHFSILREDVRVARKSERIAKSHMKSQLSSQRVGKRGIKEDNDGIRRIKFQFVHVWVLREYLEHDLRISDASLKIDLERLIDDLVFICLFVGNDFLPHIPSLEISEGAIDLLMRIYKKEFAWMGGYLTDSFKVNLERVEHFLQAVGSHECAIFRRRIQVQKERNFRSGSVSSVKENESKNGSSWMNSSQEFTNVICTSTTKNGPSVSPMKDRVKIVEEVWKEKYYAEKFEVESDDDREKLKRDAVMKYVEGICWFMHYYYQGVCSWQWFYPYHYAPFASDFVDLKHLKIHFTLGVPFKPFDQLMGVLPAASAHALPLSYRKLMTDPSSSIIEFYPPDFELDLNGKRFSWQAVCKLPFVEESRLLDEIKKLEHTLTDDEKRRNSCSLDALFVHTSHPLAAKIVKFFERRKGHPKLLKVKLKKKLDPTLSGGMSGYIYISDKTILSSETYSPVEGMKTIAKNRTIFVYYKAPPNHIHIPKLPIGATLPKKSISKKDVLPPPVPWHEKSRVRRRIYSEKEKNVAKENNRKSSILGKRKQRDQDRRTKRKRRNKHNKRK
uniref:5'-3' exoribonuclease n=1 Tax=Ananas comosus var. bracteatus TaxID=296719 RepID=A0A6V7PYA8_ANACO|nr:unnamed protein product [Ananas comosus var. bracteatus]